ncbi:hypothetical protein [Phytohabitans houttuyneae]|uniref:Uncharacterized protein n=1 Tax=Phytohabitans houttuyneae TaxID=1076126 RepID=A0A6V8KD13_9ACTN|nr:hypothetical protein [Phytohabitans houttuyneae]GFJ80019.1 hypothetical protein Phou_041990 [Phytohabitans houttuyneae]
MEIAFGWPEIDALGFLVGGVFTALVFGGALWVIRGSTGVRRSEQRMRDEERRDDERRQARLVVATLGKIGDSEVHVEVLNHSDAPIWDIKVFVPGREHTPLLIERVDSHGSGTDAWFDAPDDWYRKYIGAGGPGTPDWLPLDVVFVDNADRRWHRSGWAEPVRPLDGEDVFPI